MVACIIKIRNVFIVLNYMAFILRSSSYNQELLKSVSRAIWSGEKIGLITKNDVRVLMEDEKYRSYLLIKLLAESMDFLYDVDSHIPDIVSVYMKLDH